MTKTILRKIIALTAVAATIACILILQSFATGTHTDEYAVVNQWELPEELDEISGIAWLSQGRFVAIDDGEDNLYVYNAPKNEIERKIDFGKKGDYEGLALMGQTAYVMRSDGLLFEALDFLGDDMLVNRFETGFDDKNNFESLALDKAGNRLLMIAKDKDPSGNDNLKSIYAFDLSTHRIQNRAVGAIDLKADIFDEFRTKKEYKTLRPSDMAVHPKTQDIYIVDGVRPKLIYLSAAGKVKRVIIFDEEIIRQPEGIAFSPDGKIFIASEADGKKAMITEIRITD